MQIKVLMENTSVRPDLICEHGLSLYLEVCGRKILFDAGQTDAFAENAAKMGVDLKKVDAAILSHGHYDHGGGMLRFLENELRTAHGVNEIHLLTGAANLPAQAVYHRAGFRVKNEACMVKEVNPNR